MKYPSKKFSSIYIEVTPGSEPVRLDSTSNLAWLKARFNSLPPLSQRRVFKMLRRQLRESLVADGYRPNWL